MTRLRVLSFNIHSCRGVDGRCSLNRISAILDRLRPDVVALQEVTRGSADQLLRLTELWPCQYRFMRLVDKRSGTYGIALLSRLNILEYTEQRLTKNWMGIPGEQRGVQSLLLRPPRRGTIRVLNTHLALSRYHRRHQTESLLKEVGEAENPLVLMGDLNCGPRSPSYRRLANKLKACSGASEKSWPSLYPLRAIDHIFVSSGIGVLDCFVDRGTSTTLASDHLPLVCDLAIP